MKKIAAVDYAPGRHLIRIPSPRLVRLAARSAILTLAVLAIPYLRSAVKIPAGAVNDADDVLFLPAIFYDLEQEGILKPDHRAVLIHGNSEMIEYSNFKVITADRALQIPDGSVDLVFIAGGGLSGELGFVGICEKLKNHGIIALRLNSHSPEAVRAPPAGFRVIYFRRRLGSTVVAMRKTRTVADIASASAGVGRRLMTVPQAKKAALAGLEDALLEPPAKETAHKRRPRYLPELTGESLAAYPRRVFIDVGGDSSAWFKKHYPTSGLEFEVVQLEAVSPAAVAVGGIAEWLEENVSKEEYVVVKAEAEAAEEIIRGNAVELVDELFLECRHQWQRGRRRGSRAYWECLALYGKLRDEGVAVHQWWG